MNSSCLSRIALHDGITGQEPDPCLRGGWLPAGRVALQFRDTASRRSCTHLGYSIAPSYARYRHFSYTGLLVSDVLLIRETGGRPYANERIDGNRHD